MSEEEQLQFLDSRVDYLEPILQNIMANYGSDAVEIVTNVDIETINALTDSAGKRRQFIEFVNSDGVMEIKSKNSEGVEKSVALFSGSKSEDKKSRIITPSGQLKNLYDDL